MNNLENDLLKIYAEIVKVEYYLVESRWTRAKEKVDNAPKEEFTVKAQEIMAKIFVVFVHGIKENYNRICEGKTHILRVEDLDKLEAHYQEILKGIDKLNQKFPQIVKDDFVSETKEGIKLAREATEAVLRDFARITDEFDAFDKENFSWSEVERLWNKAEQKASTSVEEHYRWSEVAKNRKTCFRGEIVFMAIEFVEAINQGKGDIPLSAYPSTHEELNFFQEIADEFPKILDFSLKTLDEEDKKDDYEFKIQEIKAKNEELKTFIQQQRKKLGSFSANRPVNKPDPQDQQKLQTQQNEIELLKQQLTDLTKQIEEMKKNKANLTDQTAGQEVIEKLQNEKQRIETNLEKKQSQQKELKDKVNSQINSQQDSKFNWLYVVIPGGILLVIAGIVIAYLLGKKNKKE